MKSILNELKISGRVIVILLIFNITTLSFSENILKYNDSVNIRKKFFLTFDNKKWDYFVNKIIRFEENKVGMACVRSEENYELVFYSAESGWKNFNSFGTFKYLFDKNKNLLTVKIILQNNDNTYMLFSRDSLQKFDLYLFGKILKENIPYYFQFDSLKFISIYSIISLLEQNGIKNEILIEEDDSPLKERFIKEIILPSIIGDYVNDGARNDLGEFVYISTGEKQIEKDRGFNCSGFVKEVADNYIRLFHPDFGWLKIDELKAIRKEEREKMNFQYQGLRNDPLFGREWAENIMDKINSLCHYRNVRAVECSDDEYAFYNEDRGYYVSDLKNILFRDQHKNSSYFYILVFSRISILGPAVPEYYHMSIVVPYFNNYQFFIRVFESDAETNFNNLLKSHDDEKVLIIRVPIPIQFL